MTKLNKENQSWLDDNLHETARYKGYDSTLDREVIEQKLLEMQTQLEQVTKERDELAVLISNGLRIALHPPSDKAIVNALTGNGNKAKKVLAKHDKQVKIDAINDLLDWGAAQTYNNWIVNPMNGVERPPIQSIRNNGYGIQSSQIQRYLEQLKGE